MIYNSLNRVVLFVLSRKSNQWDKVEALKKLRSVRTIIFGSGNHQQEFFGCLVHVLMQLVDGLPISLESGNRTQWHVRVAPVSTDGDSLDGGSSSNNGQNKSKNAREAAKVSPSRILNCLLNIYLINMDFKYLMVSIFSWTLKFPKLQKLFGGIYLSVKNR